MHALDPVADQIFGLLDGQLYASFVLIVHRRAAG